MDMSKLDEITTSRYLDLECIDDFQIQETEDAIQATCAQKTKPILEELLNDPNVKGEIRKKILKCVKILELGD